MESGAFSSLVQKLQSAITFHSDCFLREGHNMQVLLLQIFTAGCTSTLSFYCPQEKLKCQEPNSLLSIIKFAFDYTSSAQDTTTPFH